MLEYDSRRNIYIGKTKEEALDFSVENWIHVAARSIQKSGKFAVALSGGSTPKAIYEKLSEMPDAVDWKKVFLFWGDERSVPPEHPDSNYKMAMEHFSKLPIPKNQIFRMVAEMDIEKNAKDYEEKIRNMLGKSRFDLVMLGVGEDGHTASLFPNTKALSESHALVVGNDVPQKETQRMTLTYPCINESSHIAIYALGKSKQEIVPKVLKAPIISPLPTSAIGTEKSPALWVLDADAAANL